MVDDGSSLASFKGYGFSIVELVVPDNGTYQAELNTIKALGMQPVIDVEMVIWNGGKLQNTPITSFRAYFQSLENAGWEYVASEGLNSTDLAYMQNFFKAYVNYNCDDCGLWQNLYINPFTVLNSWESYYPSEWPYIQNGSKDAAALGIQNGVMAGLWANVNSDNQIYANSLPGSSSTPSYLSMLNWSYANGIGFNQFCVWCGNDANALNDYTNLEFPQIVANLQTYYPAIALNATVSTATAYVNQNFTINGTLRTDTTGIADGNITLQRFTNNATWTNVTPPMANTTNGTGGYAFSRNESAAGTYYYRTAYDENATYTTATSNVVNVTVTKMPTALTLTASNTTPAVSQPVTFNATLSNGTTPLPGENVTVYHLLNNVRYNDTTNTTNSTGQITVTTSFGSPGTRTYYATFAGDSSYQNSTSSVVTINVTTVTKMPTALTVSVPSTASVNQNFTVNGTLSASAVGMGNATITLQRSTDNVTWYNVTTNVTNATGGYQFSNNESAAGTYYYRTAYDENATYTTATSNVVNVTVTKMPTALTVSVPSTASVNQNFTVNGTLSASAVGMGNATITLQRSTDNVTWYNVTTNVTNATGGYQFSNNESAAGTYYYRTAYDENATYTTATSNVVNVTVTKMPTALTLTASNTTPAVSQPVTFNATLSNGTTPLPGENVTVYHLLNNVRYNDTTNTTNSTGQITVTTSFGSPGTRTYYATFAGDSSYQNSTSSVVTINVTTVTKMPTALTLTASNTTPLVNQPVTFNATLSSSGASLSGENVTIYHLLSGIRYNDTTNVTNSTGQITLTTSWASPGTRSYYATFAGDSSYQASTCGVVTVNVTAKTNVTLTPSTTTPAVNQSVTFTATLSWWNPATSQWVAVTASGKPIQIWHTLNGVRYNDTTIYTNASGTATFTQKWTSAGTRYYYATFAGDTWYNASTSTVLAITVH